MTIAIYFGIFIATALYALLLQSLKRRYEPRWTWATVVGGNFVLGMGMLALSLTGILPMAAFWHLLGINITGGLPIIAWQLWQEHERQRELLGYRGGER